ncbi:AMP-binding protein [Streptomyces werraensis]|nr:AMP-binding protein [Streptomyces werraensis]
MRRRPAGLRPGLNRRANRLARLLVARGAGPESLVALCLPRTAGLLPVLWAVLKSGAGYLPVDPGYPAERIRFMLTDAAPALVLATRETAHALPEDCEPLLLEDVAPFVTDTTADAQAGTEAGLADPAGAEAGLADADLTDADRRAPLHASHPAYVIYTSGSTGRPRAWSSPTAAWPRWQRGPGTRSQRAASPT